ncbi:hypothetical protein H0H93_011760 [Arthromyces matolae]|nr:hypothetical protein H0H93_011760 [Arthromyces matolae]
MSRIPPNLLYLTIYNPALQPLAPIQDDDEDAEEQAHILFYTSKERAVSRDRMLRQVGLAKALVNFSDSDVRIFNGVDPCNNVHSQSKRMIMVSPEPNFWIHAAVEVAKGPRASDKGKGKSNSNEKGKGKGKDQENNNTSLYDYQEGSVHDISLRADILRGYEQFKLTHGSFTNILSTIGREGLELQLERFFTVWAWSWNLEDGAEFDEQLGMPLHPLFRSINHTIDDMTQHFPDSVSSIIIVPPYIIPSKQYFAGNYPISLPRHLLSLIPPNSPESEPISYQSSSRSRRASDGDIAHGKDPPLSAFTSSFLGMPKWGWPAALTFGKGASKRPAMEEIKQAMEEQKEANKTVDEQHNSSPSLQMTSELDRTALEDAMSSDGHRSPPAPVTDGHILCSSAPQKGEPQLEMNQQDDISPSTSDHDALEKRESSTDVNICPGAVPSLENDAEHTVPEPRPSFSSINIHLAKSHDPLLTTRHKIYYMMHNRTMMALIGVFEERPDSLFELSKSASALLQDVENLLSEDLSKTLTPDQIPSVSKVLQPTDIHVMSAGRFTITSPNFSSKSSYLYDTQALQARDPDISEVFSRGLNPQHWHIARRGIGPTSAEYNPIPYTQEIYMQIFRKEASLSDVDNVVAGVVKNGGLLDGPA